MYRTCFCCWHCPHEVCCTSKEALYCTPSQSLPASCQCHRLTTAALCSASSPSLPPFPFCCRVLTTRRVGKCAPLQAPPVKATNPDAVNSTPASPGTPELPAPRVRELAGDLLQPLGLGGFPVGSFEGFQASLPGFQAKMTGELL